MYDLNNPLHPTSIGNIAAHGNRDLRTNSLI